MRKFILKIIFFVLPLLVLMYGADSYISTNLKGSHESPGEIEVWNDIYNGDIDANLAIYGSSRSWVHISPQILEDSLSVKAYNFGIDGHSFWLQYLRNIEYLEHNKLPKTIVVSVDMFSLVKRKDLYESKQFLPYMLGNNDIMKYTSSYIGFGYEDYYLPLVRYYGQMRGPKSILKVVDSKTFYRDKGYKGVEREWNNDLEKAKSEMEYYTVNIHEESVILFDQFLSETTSKGIEVILVYTPEYIEGQEFVNNRQEIIDMFKEFSSTYNLLFLDYSDDDLCKDKTYFYNASHLNKKGSELFTRKLSSDLKARTAMHPHP